MKNKLRLFALLLVVGVGVIASCTKDEFSEKDALAGQKDLLTLADSLNKVRDSLLVVGGRIDYTVNVINAGNAGFMRAKSEKSVAANGLSGVSVTTSQFGVVITKQTDDNGMVSFSDLRMGKVAVNVSLANFTSVSYIAEITPIGPFSGDTKIARVAATQVPIFPLTGTATTTVSGLMTYQSDLTNTTREVAANVPISASIDVSGSFMSTYINTSGYDGSGQIIKIAYGDAVVKGTTDANGLYSLVVPTTVNGLPIRLDVADLAVNQTLLTNTLNGLDVFGVQTIRTIFSQNAGVPATAIPAVRPAYVTFAAPTGNVVGGAPTSPATATAVISAGEVESINITNNGDGYTQTPIVKITGNGTGATATATLTDGKVTGIVVNTKGSNYTTATISLSETGGVNATATAILSKKLKSVSVSNGGANYSAAPTVTIDGDGTGATAQANMNGYVSQINITNAGAGYTTDPTVTISGGAGVGATATAYLTTGNLRTITVPADADSWFTSIPTVSFVGTGGSQVPTATATLNTVGRISSIPVNNAGSGYVTPPAVAINGGGGSGAVAVAVLGPGGSVAYIDVINQGSNYSSTTLPTVTITAPPTGGTQATVNAVIIERRISGVTVDTPGAEFTYGSGGGSFDGTDVRFNGNSIAGTQITLNRSLSFIFITNSGNDFTSAPSVVISGDNTTPATATAELKYAVQNIVVTNQGSGYTTATVKFVGDGTGALATATLGDAYISNVILTNTGSGYTAAPYVEITGGGSPNNNAVVTAVISGDKVSNFSIDQPGMGYSFAPTVTIKTYKTLAVANANLNSGKVVAVSVTSPGVGYTTAPIVEFESASGTGALATAVLDGQGRVQQINITNAGSGYLTAPMVNLVVPNATSTAKGYATVNAQGVVTGITVTEAGEGYVTAPEITITPAISGMGTGATAIAKISGGTVTSVTITNGGSGFKGQNNPGNFYPVNASSTSGDDFTYSSPYGPTVNVKSGSPMINDIYLGTGVRTITQ